MKRLFLLLLLFTGCSDPNQSVREKELDDSSYIIFGHFYGFCQGETCIETYKLTNESLLEDTKDNYSFDPELAHFVLLDDNLFERVKGLRENIPTKLLTIEETTIGQPDAGDWGGLYFEIVTPERRQYWMIDKMRSNLPDFLIPFANEIENAINIIHQ